MQSVPHAGLRDHTILDDAPAPQTEQRQIAANRSAPLDDIYETVGCWLYRITFVVAPVWYVARLAKMPLAEYLTEATLSIMIILLLHSLAGYVLKHVHLVSDACFDRPAFLLRPHEAPPASNDVLHAEG
jgi:hypothetical protein